MTSIPQSVASFGDGMGHANACHMEATFRKAFAGEHLVVEDRFIRVVTREPHPLGNFAFINDSHGLDDVQSATGPLQAVPLSMVLFKTAPSPEVHEFLIGQGYAGPTITPAMAVDIKALAPTSLPHGYEFVRLDAESDAEGWVDAVVACFKLPRKIASLCSPLTLALDAAPDASLQCFAVIRDGRTVATSLTCFADGLAGIYNVATLPEERGKGLGAHVTAEPLRMAHALGYRVGILQASSIGLPVYRRLGFIECGGNPVYVRRP